ncbi:MAG: Omp28 family outer membrane lipoprotein [Bacteroidaceae bacterium]|nr:Omp28 family outer membrane lipoprotein [Bacteroidaceae bacterium]
MKKALYLLTLPLLFACSDFIPEDERYIELPNVDCKRNILIEDFTGQLCSNCPDAHQVITKLQQLYGENIIAVAIHAGHFGIAEGSNEKIIGLMQPEGNTYADHLGVSSYPAGIINRTSGIIKHTEWAAYARQALEKEPVAAINVTGDFSADSSKLTIKTELVPLVNTLGKLQVWITESRIEAVQQKGEDLITDYKHHHVYRASANGLWGEDILLEEGTPFSREHEIDVKENWDAKNLSIVAFLYNDTDGVLQAAEHSFIKGELGGKDEPENDDPNTDYVEVKALTYLCDEDTIANGSTFTSSKLDEAYTAVGKTRFVPGITLVGDRDGQVVVTVKSLNETMVEICAFGGCQMTLPHLGYQTSATGEISARTRIPLDIHYTPAKASDTYRAEALISVYYEDKPDEVASFTLVMTNE